MGFYQLEEVVDTLGVEAHEAGRAGGEGICLLANGPLLAHGAVAAEEAGLLLGASKERSHSSPVDSPAALACMKVMYCISTGPRGR